jgi:hypothetical protein
MSKSTETALAAVPSSTETALAVVPSALTAPRAGSAKAARHRQASADIADLLLAVERGAVTVCFRGETHRPSDILAGLKKRAAKAANAWMDAVAEDDTDSK